MSDTDTTSNATTQRLAQQYECERTLQEVEKHGYRRVALQFPDGQLKDAPRVCQWLMAQSRIRQQQQQQQGQDNDESAPPTVPLFFVIGDTSYGSCCVDEVAAQHLNADLVVHYGHACLSPISRLPVLYVFGRRSFPQPLHEVATCIASTLKARHNETRAFLFFDLAYEAIIPSLGALVNEQLSGSGIHLYVARLPLAASTPLLPTSLQSQTEALLLEQRDEATAEEGHKRVIFAGGLELEVEKEGEDEEAAAAAATVAATQAVVIYFGRTEGNKQLANIMLRFNACTCLSYDPTTPPSIPPSSPQPLLQPQSLSTNQELKRRYYLVQRARDASVFGIVVGTLGVGRYMGVVSAVRRLISQANKKSYTLLVGKLNPSKLANFAEIDAFVLVACPETSLLEEGGREYHAPVVTPLELEMALGGKAWDGFYSTDFRELGSLLLEGGSEEGREEGREEGEGKGDEEGEDGEGDEPYFSLVSGGFKGGSGGGRAGVSASMSSSSSSSSTTMTQFSSPASDFLQLREYRGLGHDKLVVRRKEGEEGREEGGEEEEEEEGRPPEGIVEGRTGIASDYDNV